MMLIGIAIVGACLGVVLASARVPKVKWAPVISCLILSGAAAAVLVFRGQVLLVEGLMLPLGLIIAEALYAGALWMQLRLEPGVTYWDWVVRSVTRSGYLRRMYGAQQTRNDGIPASRTH
ncbi:hypothetical protein IWX64_003229 [Arthrobacter sp. CAN_A212]|nr:hypothetical protein [Arthrobacter sp. CAN_C5]